MRKNKRGKTTKRGYIDTENDISNINKSSVRLRGDTGEFELTKYEKRADNSYGMTNTHGIAWFGSLIILVVTCIFAVYLMNTIGDSKTKVEVRGVGNPYQCEKCKVLEYACNKHINFNQEDELDKKIDLAILYYGLNENNGYYGKNSYNTSCDFCNKEGKECYNCQYDRLSLEFRISDILKDEEFMGRMCEADRKLGFASCSNCKLLLKNTVHNNIKTKQVFVDNAVEDKNNTVGKDFTNILKNIGSDERKGLAVTITDKAEEIISIIKNKLE